MLCIYDVYTHACLHLYSTCKHSHMKACMCHTDARIQRYAHIHVASARSVISPASSCLGMYTAVPHTGVISETAATPLSLCMCLRRDLNNNQIATLPAGVFQDLTSLQWR